MAAANPVAAALHAANILVPITESLRGTLSPDSNVRRQAEQHLTAAKASPGFLKALILIIEAQEVEDQVAQSAAVYLKNEIRASWNPVDERISAEEKDAVRNALFPLMCSLFTRSRERHLPQSLIHHTDDCVRYIAVRDYPEKWPGILTTVVQGLQQRESVDLLRTSLRFLRRMVKKFEFYGTSKDNRPKLMNMCSQTFPLLLQLASDVTRDGVFASDVSSELVKLCIKIYWSAAHICRVPPEALGPLPGWMLFVSTLLSTPVVIDGVDEERASNMPAFKAKKWGLRIADRLLSDFIGHENEALYREYVTTYANPILGIILQQLEGRHKGAWLPHEITALCLEYCSSALQVAKVYKELKPHVQWLLFDFCFPGLCYTKADIEAWAEDPAEYSRHATAIARSSPRYCYVSFVQAVIRYRSKDWFEPVNNFVERVLTAYESDPAHKELLSPQKQGALFIIGALAARLTSKKRNLSLEGFLSRFVLPELANKKDKFLRLWACWVYREFYGSIVDDATSSAAKSQLVVRQPTQLEAAFRAILDLCVDPELPVAIEAGIALRGFFGIQCLKNVIVPSMPLIMDRLFAVMARAVENDALVCTLESLVSHYDNEVPPYAVRLCAALSEALVRMIDASTDNGDVSPLSGSLDFSSDTAITAFGLVQTIVAVLSAVSESKFQNLFGELALVLSGMLDRLLSPEGVEKDIISELVVLFTFLTYNAANLSAPVDLWRWYERLYQMVCGGNSAHLSLPADSAEGFATDESTRIVAPICNMISKDLGRFLTGVSSIGGKSFIQLYLEMCTKLCSAIQSPMCEETLLAGLALLAHPFAAALDQVPAVNGLIAPCTDIVYAVYVEIQKAGSGNGEKDSVSLAPKEVLSLSAVAGRAFATMVLYNADEFLACIQAKNFTAPVLELLAVCKGTAKGSSDTLKALSLAICKFLDWSANQKLTGLPLPSADVLAVQLARTTKRMIEKRRQEDKEWESDEDDSDDDDLDSEQDLEEDQDAGAASHQKFLERLRRLREEGRDDDDDSDSDDDFDLDWAIDSAPITLTPFDNIDELAVIATMLQKLQPLFVQVLGTDDLQQLAKFMEEEKGRRDQAAKDTD